MWGREAYVSLYLPLPVDLLWFKAMHCIGNVTLLPKTIQGPIILKPWVWYTLSVHRKEILMNSKYPISDWGELVLSERNHKWPGPEQKSNKHHTFGVLTLSDPPTNSTTCLSYCVLVLILVLSLYEYKEVPHNNLGSLSIFWLNLSEALLNPPSCSYWLFFLVSALQRRWGLASKLYQSSPCQPTGLSETSVAKVYLVLVISAPQKLTQRGAEKTSIWIVLEETVTAELTFSGKMKAEKTSDCCM